MQRTPPIHALAVAILYGSLSIASASALELLGNGGFELGSDRPFNTTDEWTNAGPSQTTNCRNTNDSRNGSYRGVIGNGNNGLIHPTVDTGYTIQSGDSFELRFYHGAASGWDVNTDTITATVFYNDGSEQVLSSTVVTPSQQASNGYDDSGVISISSTAGSVGQSLQLRFTSSAGNSEFGALDDISLVRTSGPSSPNIIHILVDDWGWTDSSVSAVCMDNVSDFYETPNLQTLSDEGVNFTWAYAQPNCAPTRAAFMTGQYAPRTGNGVYNVQQGNKELDRQSGTTFLNPGVQDNDDYISGDAQTITLAEALKAGGYITAHIGKYHVGDRNTGNDTNPLNQGFDFNYGGTEKGNPGNFFSNGSSFNNNVGTGLNAFAADYTQAYVDANIKPFENGNTSNNIVGTRKHLTDATADAFEDFMDAHLSGPDASSPVYIQYHFYATHSPLEGRSDLVAKYNAKKNATPPTYDTQVHFAALTEGMDQAVGRVRAYLLDPNGDGNTSDSIADNTLILFTGDNGGDSRNGFTSNHPLRGTKGNYYEGGIRVPLIAWMPGTVGAGNPGAISDSMVHMVDYYPTILDAAGISYPDSSTHPLDGESFWAHVQNPGTVARNRAPIYFHFPGYMDDRMHACSWIIKEVDGKRYKYIYAYDPYYAAFNRDQYQLYNLSDDLSESVNLLDYIDLENEPDAGDPDDSREYWDYLLHKATADNLAADMNAWLNQSHSTWQPLFASYQSNFPAGPTRNGAADGTSTGAAPATTPAESSIEAPTDFSFELLTPVFLGSNDLQFNFDSHPGFYYQVQASNTLAPDSWDDIGAPALASGGSTQLVVNDPDSATETKRFYRIVLVNAP